MERFNKKAQQVGNGFNKTIISIAIVIITIVVLFNVFASLVPEAQSAGDQFSDATRCSDAGGNFNVSQALCLNGTSPADTGTVNFEAIPVATLFSGTGVVILLLMVFLIIGILRIVLPSSRSK